LKKYFALTFGTSPIDRMNKKGVEYALQGRFKEAEILFQEILNEEARCGAALNNLGIIYEIFCHYDSAFRMYAQACLLEPGNEKFRRNFLSLKKMTRTSPQ
jgi:tetratricopeptide (TPR) repeat protein